MPKKLEFQVVHVSGYDAEHSPKELEIHSPVTRGWQSQKFCVYPQEVVLKLRETALLRKLQILSHQYLVSSKIEIYAGLSPNQQNPSLMTCEFKRLGYISLAENKNSDFKSRELKSVSLEVECHFVKFVVHKNHVNKYNLYNQVNIIAINLIGDPVDEMYTETRRLDRTAGGAEEILQQFMKKHPDSNRDIMKSLRPDYISPLDDLAFDIYQDPETAQLIRKLEMKKQDAVLEERFDYAKKLKQAMADLHKVGEKLGKLEVEKRRAIEMEDYDLAKAKKLQGDEYRLHVYKQLDLYDLLELNKVELKPQQTIPVSRSPLPLPIPSETRIHHASSHVSPVLPQIATTVKTTHDSPLPCESPSNSPTIRTPEPPPRLQDPEDRPIQAVKKKIIPSIRKDSVPTTQNSLVVYEYSCRCDASKVHFEEQMEQSQGKKDSEEEPLQELSAKDEAEAGPIIDVFGMRLVQLAFSKSWLHRQEAMEIVYKEITAAEPSLTSESEAKAVVRATALLMKRMLLEKVFTIFTESIKIEKSLLTDYIPQKNLGKSEYTFVIDKTFPTLLSRTGDMAARTKDIAINLILEIAVLKEVKALGSIPELAVQPIKSKGQAPWRLFKGRLEVILKLLEPLDVDKQGSFTTEGVMKIVLKALDHSHKDVREVAIEILFVMYKKVGSSIRTYLPDDDNATRKNPLYGRIFDGFDKIDGKPTKAERKLLAKQEKEQSEKAKKGEIAELQAQLQALRAAADEIHQDDDQKPEDGTKSTDNKEQQNNNIEKTCMFCGEQNDKFTEEAIEVHYWKSCPMLQRCTHCSQAVEICNLNEHFLSECEKKSEFKKCPRCQEAILKTELDAHLKAKTCQATRGAFNRCPLCKEKVLQGEEGWKKHLMNVCKANVKRLQNQKQNAKAARKPSVGKKGTGGSQPFRDGVKRRTSKAIDKNAAKT